MTTPSSDNDKMNNIAGRGKVEGNINTNTKTANESTTDAELNTHARGSSTSTVATQNKTISRKRKKHVEFSPCVQVVNNKRRKIERERYSTRTQTARKRRPDPDLSDELCNAAPTTKKRKIGEDIPGGGSKGRRRQKGKSKSTEIVQNDVVDSNDERYQCEALGKPVNRKAQQKDAKLKLPITKTGKTDPPGLQPSPYTSINAAVKAQVELVRDFIETIGLETSVLERVESDKNVITVPESALLAAILSMYIRYEIPMPNDPSIFDVKSIILDRHVEPVGEMSRIDFVTIDTTRDCSFLEGIKEKVMGSGLEDLHLLEIQLEILKREQLRISSLPKCWHEIDNESVKLNGDQFLSAVATAWDEAFAETRHHQDADKEDQYTDKEHHNMDMGQLGSYKDCEIGRRGACVAPSMPT